MTHNVSSDVLSLPLSWGLLVTWWALQNARPSYKFFAQSKHLLFDHALHIAYCPQESVTLYSVEVTGSLK
jgi:hypothetical protein